MQSLHHNLKYVRMVTTDEIFIGLLYLQKEKQL